VLYIIIYMCVCVYIFRLFYYIVTVKPFCPVVRVVFAAVPQCVYVFDHQHKSEKALEKFSFGENKNYSKKKSIVTLCNVHTYLFLLLLFSLLFLLLLFLLAFFSINDIFVIFIRFTQIHTYSRYYTT